MKRILTSLLIVAALLMAGCATEHYMTDAKHPEIHIKEDGGVTYRGRYVDPEDLPGLLKDSGLTKQDTINIHIPENLPDFRVPRKVMGILSQNGFTRPILVSDRKAYSEVGKTAEQRRQERAQQYRDQMKKVPPAQRAIRYKN